jgi:ribosomal protein L37AE/L43A
MQYPDWFDIDSQRAFLDQEYDKFMADSYRRCLVNEAMERIPRRRNPVYTDPRASRYTVGRNSHSWQCPYCGFSTRGNSRRVNATRNAHVCPQYLGELGVEIERRATETEYL